MGLIVIDTLGNEWKVRRNKVFDFLNGLIVCLVALMGSKNKNLFSD